MKNELTIFESGGSHENNSLGGIPVTSKSSVEENETKIKIGDHQYIFSDRLSTKQAYINKFYLPSYIAKKSFAEASKAIEDRFKDRTDNASNSTKDELFSRLQEAQELAKLEKEASSMGITVDELLIIKQQEAEEQAQAQAEAEAIAQQEATGQAQQNPAQLEEGGNVEEGVDEAGLVAGAAGLFNLGASNLEAESNTNVGGAAMKGAITGAALGSVVPGIGTAIGGVFGGGIGAVTAGINNQGIKEQEKKEFQKNAGAKLLSPSGRAYGGYIEKMHEGGGLAPHDHPHKFVNGQYFYSGKDENNTIDRPIANTIQGYSVGINPDINPDISYLPGTQIDPYKVGLKEIPINKPNIGDINTYNKKFDISSINKENTDKDGFPWLPVAAGAASLAPFVGNLIEGANLDAPEANRYARTGRTYLPNFADEQKLLNVVDQSFGSSEQAIANASVGNIGAYRANLLGSNINKARARSNAFANINDINRQEISNKNADYAAALKEDTALTNQENLENKQDRAAYDAAKGAYRTAAYEGLGQLGETIFKANQMADMTTYDWLTGKKKKQDGKS